MDITGGIEILQIVDAVAREKAIPKDAIITALCRAVEAVAKRKYGTETSIYATIDQRSGTISLKRIRSIVDNIDDEDNEILLEEARIVDSEAQLGTKLIEELPPIEFGRVNSQYFKQIMTFNIKQAEKEKEYNDFKDRVGEIITAVVKRVEYGSYIVEFGSTETILPKDQAIPRENFHAGDRIRAIIKEVNRETKNHQIVLSRAAPEFLSELFSQEVPEIYDGLVSIKSVVRDAGSRAKIAVYSGDKSLDPVGACIGPRGSRVTAVYNELQGEKIDIIEWSEDLATYTVNAITSKTKEDTVEVSKLVIDEENGNIEIVVPDNHLSLAIGRRGQNVRLAARLIGWSIDVMSESDENEKRNSEFEELSTEFANILNLDDIIGQLLAAEGFKEIEEIAYCDIAILTEIEGFDQDIAKEIQSRAGDYIIQRDKELSNKWRELGVSEDILDLPNVNHAFMIALGENEITTITELADLSLADFERKFASLNYGKNEIREMLEKAVNSNS